MHGEMNHTPVLTESQVLIISQEAGILGIQTVDGFTEKTECAMVRRNINIFPNQPITFLATTCARSVVFLQNHSVLDVAQGHYTISVHTKDCFILSYYQTPTPVASVVATKNHIITVATMALYERPVDRDGQVQEEDSKIVKDITDLT